MGHGAAGDVPSLPPPVPVPEPRALLDALLTSPLAPDALRAQAAVATVSEACSCGCPSIAFAVPADAPRAVFDVAHADVRGAGDASIEAVGRIRGGREVDVVLHAADGVLSELEVWSGTWGGDPRVPLPDPARLRFGAGARPYRWWHRLTAWR